MAQVEKRMSRWRRRALEVCPELRRELNSPDFFSIYALWFELGPMAIEAYRSGNASLHRRILDYAEWCEGQDRSQQLWNSVSVSFYENLFRRAGRDEWPEVVGWLSPRVIRNVCVLWDLAHPLEEASAIRELIVERHGEECVARWTPVGSEDLLRSADEGEQVFPLRRPTIG